MRDIELFANYLESTGHHRSTTIAAWESIAAKLVEAKWPQYEVTRNGNDLNIQFFGASMVIRFEIDAPGKGSITAYHDRNFDHSRHEELNRFSMTGLDRIEGFGPLDIESKEDLLAFFLVLVNMWDVEKDTFLRENWLFGSITT